MSYMSFALLTEDIDFGRRSRACITEQANSFQSSSTANVAALAAALLKMEAAPTVVMLTGICAGPGFDTQVDNGDGTIDQTKITDNEILSQTQAIFPNVAGLFFDSTGAPI